MANDLVNESSGKPLVFGTGLSGLVGSKVVEILSDEYDFFNLDLTQGINILEPETVAAALASRPGVALLHFAAFTDANAAEEQRGNKQGSAWQVNVTGTENMVRACQEHNLHLVHISTGYVFDGQKKEAYVETDPTNPIDWYGETKVAAEELITSQSPGSSIFRINFPYRQDDFPKKDIWHKMAEALQQGKDGPFFSDHFFSLTPIEWFAEVIRWAIQHPEQAAGIFHAVSDTAYTDLSLAQEIARSLGIARELKGSSVLEYNRTAARPYAPSLILSNEKLTRARGHA